MTREEFVKSKIKETGMNLKQFAASIDIPYTTLLSIINDSIGGASVDRVIAICKALNITVEELNSVGNNKDELIIATKNHINKYNRLDKHGKKVVDDLIDSELERIEEEQRIRDEKSKHKTLSSNELTTQDVLTFDLPASAGTGMFLDSESCEHIEYPADIVPTGTDFAIRISGNSMEPKYLDGSTAFVRKVEVSDGDIGIFVLNGDGYIKKLEYRDSGTYLVSLNPKYDDIKILESDSLYCVGKVLN